MKEEPMVTILLSDYQELINKRNAIMQNSFTVGQQYEFIEDGVVRTYFCQSFDPTGYHLIGNNNGTMVRLSIKLKK